MTATHGPGSGNGRQGGHQGDPQREERPLASLFSDLLREGAGLMRAEVELARAEIVEKTGAAAGGAGMIVAGALVAFTGALALVAAAILALSLVLDPWLAALVIGAAIAVVGVVLIFIGRRRLSLRTLRPDRSLAALKGDTRWARAQFQR